MDGVVGGREGRAWMEWLGGESMDGEGGESMDGEGGESMV